MKIKITYECQECGKKTIYKDIEVLSRNMTDMYYGHVSCMEHGINNEAYCQNKEDHKAYAMSPKERIRYEQARRAETIKTILYEEWLKDEKRVSFKIKDMYGAEKNAVMRIQELENADLSEI